MSFFSLRSSLRAAAFVSILSLGSAGAWAQGAPQPEPASTKGNNLFFDAVRARNKGEDKQAAALFQQFTTLNPNEPAGWYELARLSLREANGKQAEEYAKKAIALEPGNKWYQNLYAEALAFQNRYKDAADVLSKLADGERFNEEYRMKAALLYQREKKYKESLAQLDKLLERDPSDEDILQAKQQVYLKMNDLEGAVKISQALIAANPKEARFYAQLAQLYDNNKKPEEATKIYEQALKLFPDDPVIQLTLAEHYRKEKNEAKYEEYVRKAITNKGLDAETQVGLLLPYLQEMVSDTSRRQVGQDLAAQLAVQHPKDATVLSFYGDVLQMNGKRTEAGQQYRKAVDLDPSKFPAWQQLMFAYTSPKDADSLVAVSARALKLFPTQAVVHYMNGVGHLNRKEPKLAVNAIRRAIDLQPEENVDLLTQMYVTLGDAYQADKNYAESDSAYETALKLDPKDATVLNNYAYYLSVRNVRLEDAARMSKRSLEIRPGEGTFLDTYGWILYQQGNYKDARNYIQQAVDKAGADADGTLWDHLGDVLFKLKETDKAVEAWKRAKEKGADNANLDRKITDRKIYE
jgi:tetratricopeptide (TPR) repeat protein